MKGELGGKMMKECNAMTAKTYSYLTDNIDKKLRIKKAVCLYRKPKFEDYKNWLKATQFENKINQLEKNKVNTGSLRKNHEEFINNNKTILKTQQRFKSE